MSRYKLSRQAVEDLESIAEHIASENPSAAERVLDALHETLTFLNRHPEAGAPSEDLHPNLRVFPARKPA